LISGGDACPSRPVDAAALRLAAVTGEKFSPPRLLPS
jgi:hypothetical protein